MTPDAVAGASAGPASRVRASRPALVAQVAADFGLGPGDAWSVLATGYEDRNIDLRARRARVVIKVFARDRPASVAARTAAVIAAVRQAGVRHPRLPADAAGRDDPWAIDNLVPLAGQVGGLLGPRQRRLVDEAIAERARVDVAPLPKALIHADLTPGNVLLGPDGEVTVLDFALANRWPRLQELAVIAARLPHGAPGARPARMAAVARLYSAASPLPLTPAEERALPAFGRGAAAMELLGGLNQWRLGNRGPETDSLIPPAPTPPGA